MTIELKLVEPAALAPAGGTRIVMILDRSGSMAGWESDVIGGFNSFITTCREAGLADCSVSYVRFDNVRDRVFTEQLADVPELTGAHYAPRGSTALLDAVGQSVSEVADDPTYRYIVITFTDGHENASREWTREGVTTVIREREALGNWTFAFFGADMDAWGEAGGMGYGAGNAASHAKGDTAAMMRANARVAASMSKMNMRRSDRYAAATKLAAEDPGVSDAEIERRLASSDADDA